MPHREVIERARERYAGARIFVGLFQAFRTGLYRGDEVPDSAGVGTLMVVLCAVMIGHYEKRPMSRAKIALFLDLPPTTVLRKLKVLTELGSVARIGNVYGIAPGRAKNLNPKSIDDAMRAIRDGASVLSRSDVAH